MRKEDEEYIKRVVTEVAEIQAPTDIDPYNTDLNGSEVSQSLPESANNTIRELEDIIQGVHITKQGRIHQKDKSVLSSAGLEVSESYDPEQPDKVMIKVIIPTTEEKSMPDNYGTHKITVVRDIQD
jgi:hypothetical protein